MVRAPAREVLCREAWVYGFEDLRVWQAGAVRHGPATLRQSITNLPAGFAIPAMMLRVS